MVKHCLAVDLGASSGRTIVGSLGNGKLTLTEINRFWNGPTEIGGTLYWDFVHLFRLIKEGIAKAKKAYGDKITSMGADTWGVDFGLLDVNGHLMRNPVHYRDGRTAGMLEKVLEQVPKEEVFAQTGIQFMEINTLYQLMSLSSSDSFQYRAAAKMLFVPDLLNYWLTGEMAANFTNEVGVCNTIRFLKNLSGRSLSTLRIVGGGCQNYLLNQMAANATGKAVITGPIEATAIGNLMMQMLAMGDIESLEEGRAIIGNSFTEETRVFSPRESTVWETALNKWRDTCE